MSYPERSCWRCGKRFCSVYKEDFCRDCLTALGIKPTPYTNADHIRSMTDEELAAYILCPRDLDPRKTVCTDLTCIECAKDWLKQPYKEGN